MEKLSAVEAVERSLDAARHLSDLDLAAATVLRQLAFRVDQLNEDGWLIEGRLDNVTVPTFLRYCEQLGLTPLSRDEVLKGATSSGRAAKLTALRAERTA